MRLLTELGLSVPIVAAPMAGGPTTPDLVVAADRAGGIGFLAAGYQSAEALKTKIGAVRGETPHFGVNLFAPNPVPVDRTAYRLIASGCEPMPTGSVSRCPMIRSRTTMAGGTRLTCSSMRRVPVVSFTFGVPERAVLDALHAAGSLLVQTVTSADEARLAEAAGVDALAVQSSAAGGHWGTLTLGVPPLSHAARAASRRGQLGIRAADHRCGRDRRCRHRSCRPHGRGCGGGGRHCVDALAGGRYVRRAIVPRCPQATGQPWSRRPSPGGRQGGCAMRSLTVTTLRAVRLSGVAPLDEPGTPGRRGGRRSRVASPLGRDRLPGGDNRSRRGHHAPANGPTVDAVGPGPDYPVAQRAGDQAADRAGGSVNVLGLGQGQHAPSGDEASSRQGRSRSPAFRPQSRPASGRLPGPTPPPATPPRL